MGWTIRIPFPGRGKYTSIYPSPLRSDRVCLITRGEEANEQFLSEQRSRGVQLNVCTILPSLKSLDLYLQFYTRIYAWCLMKHTEKIYSLLLSSA